MPVDILAEPGSTHMGRRDWMLDLMSIARDAGCTAVKHQFLSSASRLCERRNAPKYLDAYRLIEGDVGLLEWLVTETHARGLEAIVTCYLPEDMHAIALRADKVKIASFEANDPLLRGLVMAYNAPHIVSTGMMTEDQIRERFTMWRHDALWAILHCVSAYPAPMSSLNLSVISDWRYRHRMFGAKIGFSDHSASTLTGALAVAAGAQVIEVHYRHPHTPPENADYNTALSPADLRLYAEGIRMADVAMGASVKTVQDAEQAMRQYVVLNGVR